MSCLGVCKDKHAWEEAVSEFVLDGEVCLGEVHNGVNHRFIICRSCSPWYHSATPCLSLISSLFCAHQRLYPPLPSHPLVPTCFQASIHSENKHTKLACHYSCGDQETGRGENKWIAIFGTWSHKKSDEANRTSFQNVPHPVFIDSFGFLATVKLIKFFLFLLLCEGTL
jgi:hypothetical protein